MADPKMPASQPPEAPKSATTIRPPAFSAPPSLHGTQIPPDSINAVQQASAALVAGSISPEKEEIPQFERIARASSLRDLQARVKKAVAKMRVSEKPDIYAIPVVAIYGPAKEILQTIVLYSQIRSEDGMLGYTIGTDAINDAVITEKSVEGHENQANIVITNDGTVCINPGQSDIIIDKATLAPSDEYAPEIVNKAEILSPTDTVTLSYPDSKTVTLGIEFRNDLHKDFIIEYLDNRIKSLLEKRTQIILEEQNPKSPLLLQLDLQIFEAHFVLSELSGQKIDPKEVLAKISATRAPFEEQIRLAKAELSHSRKTAIGDTVVATVENDFIAGQEKRASELARIAQTKHAEISQKKMRRESVICLRTTIERLQAFHLGDHESPETVPLHFKAPVLIRDGDNQMIPFIIDTLHLGSHMAATYEADAPSARNRKLLKGRLRPGDVDAIATLDRKAGKVMVTVINPDQVAIVDKFGTEFIPAGITFSLDDALEDGNKLRIANQHYRLEKDHGFSPEAYRQEASGMIEELMERILDVDRTFASADLQDPNNDDFKAYRDIILILSRLPECDAKKEQIENCKKMLADIFIHLWKKVCAWETNNPEADTKIFPTLLLLLTLSNQKGTLVNPERLKADEHDVNPVNYNHVRAQALNRVSSYLEFGRITYGKAKPGKMAMWLSNNNQKQRHQKDKAVADMGILEIARFMEMTTSGSPLITEEDIENVTDSRTNKAYLEKINKVRAIRTGIDNLKKSKGDILLTMEEVLSEVGESKMSDAYGPEEIAIININNTYTLKPNDKIENYINNIIREHANLIYRGLIMNWERLNREKANLDQVAQLESALFKLNRFLESGRVQIGHLVRTVEESRTTVVMHSKLREIEVGIKETRTAIGKREEEKHTQAKILMEVNNKCRAKMERQREVIPALLASLEKAESEQSIVELSGLLKKEYINLMLDEDLSRKMAVYEQGPKEGAASSIAVITTWADLRAKWRNQVLLVARACAKKAITDKKNTIHTLVLIKRAVTAGIFTYKDIGYEEANLEWSVIREKFNAYSANAMAAELNDYAYLDNPFFPEVTKPEFKKKLDEMRSALTVSKLRACMEKIKNKENIWFYKTIIKSIVAKDPNALGHLSSDEYSEVSAILN